MRAHPAAEAQAVLSGEHQVEHDQVEPPGTERREHLPPVGGRLDPVAVHAQETGEQIADFAVVIDHQEMRPVTHGAQCRTPRRLVGAFRATNCNAAPLRNMALRNGAREDTNELHAALRLERVRLPEPAEMRGKGASWISGLFATRTFARPRPPVKAIRTGQRLFIEGDEKMKGLRPAVICVLTVLALGAQTASASQRHPHGGRHHNHAHIGDMPNLGSRVLGLCARHLVRDWPARFHHPLVLLETFVDPSRFVGTVYRAAGWTEVGMTRGFRASGAGTAQAPRRRRSSYVPSTRTGGNTTADFATRKHQRRHQGRGQAFDAGPRHHRNHDHHGYRGHRRHHGHNGDRHRRPHQKWW